MNPSLLLVHKEKLINLATTLFLSPIQACAGVGSIASTLSTFNKLFSYTDFNDNFKAYALELFSPLFARLGWEPKVTDGEGREGSRWEEVG